MDLSLSVDDISGITRPERVAGKTTATIHRIAALADAQPGDLSFLGNRKYRREVGKSRASLIFVPSDFEGEPQPDQVYFYQENTTLALARICAEVERQLWPKPSPGVHSAAVVAEGADIAPDATVGPFCVIEEGARIGANAVLEAGVFLGRESTIGDGSWLQPNVTVMGHCQVGSRVRLYPGVVIGSDGYGFETGADGRHQKLPQIGSVVIGDDVEIGANSTIDRARFDRTEIGEGTKIDNLVQIGHNVIIGRHCLIVSQVGISGSTVLEDNVVLGGQAGVGGHLTLGRGSMVGGQSGVAKDLSPKSYVNGTPALPIMLDQKLTILRKRLPDLFRRVDTLESTMKKLSSGG